MSKRKILLIDPDESFAKELGGHLKSLPVEFEQVAAGDKGISRFQQWKPDVLLICVELNDTNGFNLFEMIKSLQTGGQCFIVMIGGTNHAASFKEHEKLPRHADMYATKPIDLNQFQNRLASRLKWIPILAAPLDATAQATPATKVPSSEASEPPTAKKASESKPKPQTKTASKKKSQALQQLRKELAESYIEKSSLEMQLQENRGKERKPSKRTGRNQVRATESQFQNRNIGA